MDVKPKIVFFGSGPVALKSLRLLTDHVDLEAIITKPATLESMQQAFAKTPVFAVTRKAELDQLCTEQKFHSKLGIVIDFGVIIDQIAIDSFPLGIINSHFSLLPEWRGVDPITFAILSGQKETGVSLMVVVRAWDEGPILAQAPYEIPSQATTPDLTDSLIEISDALLAEILPLYLSRAVIPQPQLSASIGPKEPTYSHKLTKEDGRLDWSKPAAQLEREVRGYISWPHSYTTLAGRDVIITKSQVSEHSGMPGSIVADRKHLIICCGEQALEVLRIKPAGKPEMDAKAFLAGYGRLL